MMSKAKPRVFICNLSSDLRHILKGILVPARLVPSSWASAPGNMGIPSKALFVKIFAANVIDVKNFYSVTVFTSQPMKSSIPIILRKDGKYISSKL